MNTWKKISIAAFAVVLLAVSLSFAETARLGQNLPKAFNPTNISTKTAAYTLTSTDSYIKVTAASANITITLPTVESAKLAAGGTKSYKILKTDATTYAIVITPATGDTIGGESTRYLLSQNAYVVISSGPGKNWTVEYETPYIVEDHEAGTYTTGIGSGGAYSAQTASVTLTASDCGRIISMGTGTTTVTLPATVANCEFTIINTVGAPGGITIDPNTADNIYGGCTLASSVVTISDTAGDSVTNTAGTAVKGDYMRLIGDGNVGWYITGCQGIWAED